MIVQFDSMHLYNQCVFNTDFLENSVRTSSLQSDPLNWRASLYLNFKDLWGFFSSQHHIFFCQFCLIYSIAMWVPVVLFGLTFSRSDCVIIYLNLWHNSANITEYNCVYYVCRRIEMPAFGLNLQVTYIVINVLKSYYFNALTSKMDNYILAFVQDAGEVRLFFSILPQLFSYSCSYSSIRCIFCCLICFKSLQTEECHFALLVNHLKMLWLVRGIA